MKAMYLNVKCLSFLRAICDDIGERPVGSDANRKATDLLKEEFDFLGWDIEIPEFAVIDWKQNGAELSLNGSGFNVFVSPYSLGCSVNAPLKVVEKISELENGNFNNTVLLLKGEIASEQLMPKNFVFYNPDNHKKIVSLLENSGAKAIICATGRNVALAGGVYPFPLIEDGDFNIPSVYLTEEEGSKLCQFEGQEAQLNIYSERINSKANNVIGRKGNTSGEKVVITAHIDTKSGTPGALDNASGVVTMLLLADLLSDYSGDKCIEMVALNGEDYYSNPGQMNYIQANRDKFEEIMLNINIDGPGYKIGKTSFSFFDLSENQEKKAVKVMRDFPGIVKGQPWPQGDHSIFVQRDRPAIAITSEWLLDNYDQDITHTDKDRISIIDCSKLVDLSQALNSFIRSI
ncbi:MAG: M28 family peptidase [Bacteroidota bacterium]